MAATAILSSAYRLVAIARTCTKFYMQAKFDVLHLVMP